jgi:co-chaperonin GroES (HSP10)
VGADESTECREEESMSTGQADGIKKLMERVDAENSAKSLQQIALDGSNKVSFPGFPYVFEAEGERIIVSIDIFKSGYECRTCKGKGFIEFCCPCETKDRPGFMYTEEQIRLAQEAFGDTVAQARTAMVCSSCKGDYPGARSKSTCPECNGKQTLIHLPNESKILPTTGVVVSMGPLAVKAREEGKFKFKIGDRVLFSPHAGSMIPTKAGAAFKYMDYYNAVLRIEGGEDMAAFDFVLQDGND